MISIHQKGHDKDNRQCYCYLCLHCISLLHFIISLSCTLHLFINITIVMEISNMKYNVLTIFIVVILQYCITAFHCYISVHFFTSFLLFPLLLHFIFSFQLQISFHFNTLYCSLLCHFTNRFSFISVFHDFISLLRLTCTSLNKSNEYSAFPIIICSNPPYFIRL